MSADQRILSRRLLHTALIAGHVGTGIELILLGHYEDFWQLVPVVLLAAGLAVSVWHIASSSRLSGRVLGIVMLTFVLAGLVGLGLHFNGNMEFELEMYPGLKGWPLIWKSLEGAVPALAPGTMIFVGLVGLIASRSPFSSKPN